MSSSDTVSDVETTSAAGPGPIMRGRLRLTRMPALLWELHESRATGSLRLRRADVEKWVWFVDGQPVFARSNQSEDRLTDRLLQRGLLSRAQYESAQVLIANKGARRSGEVLMEAHLIARGALDEALREHLLHMFDPIFLWEDAEWEFDPSGSCDESVVLDTPPAALIMGAARNRIHMSELWTAVGSAAQRPLFAEPERADEVARALDLLPTEALWIRRFDGSQTLGQMLADFDTDERELIATVYTLKLVGALKMA